MGTTCTEVGKNVSFIESPSFITINITKGDKIQFSISIQMPVTMTYPTCPHLLGLLLSLQTVHQTATTSGLQNPGSSDIYNKWKQNLGRKQDVIMYFTSWPQVTSEWQSMGNIYFGVFLESSFTDLRLWWTREAHRSWGQELNGMYHQKNRFGFGESKMNCWAKGRRTGRWEVLDHIFQ